MHNGLKSVNKRGSILSLLWIIVLILTSNDMMELFYYD